MDKPKMASRSVRPSVYYALYFTEVAENGRTWGPLKRLRYEALQDAVGRADQMKRVGDFNPVEIRDNTDRLITCPQMGWRIPSLTA